MFQAEIQEKFGSKRSLWNAVKDKAGGTDFESARDIQAVLNRFRAIGEIRVQTKTNFFPKCQTFEKFAHLYSQMLAPLRCQYKSLTKHSKHTTFDLNGSFRMCQKFPERCQIGFSRYSTFILETAPGSSSWITPMFSETQKINFGWISPSKSVPYLATQCTVLLPNTIDISLELGYTM